ncbi:MopE-related protein [Flavobacterium dankookense]|uniref:Putative secreted protein (Por secretion system target) n=3 Tax=Flavobacterium dankookense TaxID=706186 RepID=A0A4R6QGG7_9FLAO|nr:MopE-related protein [Flavobacterium dankookense]TDP61690.1 putative secreted protein (Por secretion system target) [Flavobacterium dankookense]
MKYITNRIFIIQQTNFSLLINYILLFLFGLFGVSALGQTQTYTSSGSFTVPAGVTTVRVQAWGGGGGGGGVNGSNSQTRAGGGGGGGTYTNNNTVSVNPLGSAITVTVGLGGQGGDDNSDGSTGGTSTFASASPVTAVGGNGGQSADGSPQYGNGGAVRVGVTNDGGAGSAGTSTSGGRSGAGGGGAGSSGDGGNASGTTGGSGGSGGGGAGANGRTDNGDGADASNLAAGGAGGRSTSNTDRDGGNGFRGQVIVTYTCPTYSLTSSPTGNNICTTAGTSTVITLTGSAVSLPVGNYTVTYNRSLPNASGLTATMSVTTAGTGTFTAVGFTSAGNSTITITNLASGGCTNSIGSLNTVVINVTLGATAAAGTAISTCYTSGGINITAGSTATNNSGITWTSSGTGSFTDANSLTLCEYTPSVDDIAAGFVTLTLTASGNSPCGDVTSTKILSLYSSPSTTGVSICQGASGSLTSAALSGGALQLNGTWAATPNAARPDTGDNSTTCDFSYSGGADIRNYTATNFQVSTTGSYTFTMTQNNAYDGMGYIVSGNFTPGSCSTGTFIRRDDDGGPDDEPQITTNLTAGVVYTLISTTYSTSSGTYIGDYQWTITPPSGGKLLPVVEWYTASSGGTLLGTGTSFNPVGVAGSGLSNTNTSGTTTFYAANSLNASCARTATTFEILTNVTYYADADADGFGDASISQVSCTGAPIMAGGNPGVTNSTDCNDADGTKNAQFPFYADNDGDGFGVGSLINVCAIDALTPPTGYSLNNTDCDDINIAINETFPFYVDADTDGFGVGSLVDVCAVDALTPPIGYSLNNTDCDDTNLLINATFPFYVDADQDGFGVGSLVDVCAVDALSPPVGFSLNNTDCDDSNVAIYQLGDFYVDADGDNYSTSATTIELCYGATEPVGYSMVSLGIDCDDTNVAIYQLGDFYVDADDDNYSTSGTTIELCYGATEPAGYSLLNLGLDCDDTIAAVNPGMAEIPYDGLDNDCDGNLDNGFPLFTSTMLNCGSTLSNIGSFISCLGTANAVEYKFEITGPNGTVTIDRNVHYFSLTQLANYQYATTYSVRVMLRRAGQTNFVGYYGDACLYSTPPVTSPVGGVGSTQLQSYCGESLPTLATLIATTSLPGVTQYRFRVTNTETGTVQTLDRNLHWFSLTMLNEFHYGTTYLVDVAVRTTAPFPAEPSFGAPCTVTTPALPSLTAYCDSVVPNKGIIIPTSSLNRATLYRFEVTRYADETLETILSTQQIDRTKHWFNFNLVTDYVPNGIYGVRVSVMTSGSFPGSSVLGQFLYGDACIIMSPNIAREATPVATSRFEAVGYPNPYDYEFGIKLDTTSDSMISIRVYDMIGKLIEQREVAPTDIPVQAIGERYPTGVYNVVVSQDGNAKSLRMIKR